MVWMFLLGFVVGVATTLVVSPTLVAGRISQIEDFGPHL